MKHFVFWVVLLAVLFNAIPVGNAHKWWALVGLLAFLDFIRFPNNKP